MHHSQNAETRSAPSLEEERGLLASARDGDAEAYVRLIKRYEQRIYRLALSVVGDHHDAEDVLQEVCLKAFTHLQGFRGDSSFFTWIARIAMNECYMRLRRRKTTASISLDEPIEGEDGSVLPIDVEDWRESPEKDFLKSELQELIARCLEKLDRTSRTVFMLRDIEQFTTEETAKLTGLTETNVKTRLHRARMKMREHLNGYFKRGESSCAAKN